MYFFHLPQTDNTSLTFCPLGMTLGWQFLQPLIKFLFCDDLEFCELVTLKKLWVLFCLPLLNELPEFPVCVAVGKSLQLCPSLCDPMDCRPPGSPVRGILQARILEWVGVPFRGSSPPRDRAHVSYVSCIDRWVLSTSAPWEARKFPVLLMKRE